MPLLGFESLCEERQKIIVSRDKGTLGSKVHRAINVDNNCVTHYMIDGVVIKEGKKCDFLLMNEDKKAAYLIELKGSDIVKAMEQLEATAEKLRPRLNDYKVNYRIILNRTNVHAIRETKFNNWLRRVGRAVVKYAERELEENI